MFRMIAFPIVAYFFYSLPLSAAKYYIDWQTGTDTNPGTSITQPWKRHPFMAGFSGSYSHSPGYGFIFKGGVSWPNSCFRMDVPLGGTSEQQRDYYGIDKSWFSGSSWSRPIFDMQSQQTTKVFNQVIYIENRVSYVTFDNIEIVNFYWAGPQSYGNALMIFFPGAQYITFSNLYVHAWTHATYAAGTRDDLKVFVGLNTSPYNVDSVIENCEITGLPNGTDSGMATIGGIPSIHDCIIHDMSNGILSSGLSGHHLIFNNTIYNINQSFDPAAHENGIETFGPAVIYNNVIHNVQHGVVILTTPTGQNPGDPHGYDYIYNNLIYGNLFSIPAIQIDENQDPISSGAYVFNNTLQSSGAALCVRLIDRGTGAFNTVSIRNNHFITEYSTPICINSSGCANATNLIVDHNLLQSNSAACAAGYSASQGYSPTSSTGPTVDTGTDLSSLFSFDLRYVVRPQGSSWDIGVYEYGFSLSPPTNLRIIR